MEKIKDAERNVAILILLIALVAIFSGIANVSKRYRMSDIDQAYRKLCDASYLIELDTTDPRYVRAYYDLREQVVKHERLFRHEYDSFVVTDLLLASDIVDRTTYLDDFRCTKSLQYVKAYFDYYPDELEKVEDAYFQNKGCFRPQYLNLPNAPNVSDRNSDYYFWLP